MRRAKYSEQWVRNLYDNKPSAYHCKLIRRSQGKEVDEIRIFENVAKFLTVRREGRINVLSFAI